MATNDIDELLSRARLRTPLDDDWSDGDWDGIAREDLSQRLILRAALVAGLSPQARAAVEADEAASLHNFGTPGARRFFGDHSDFDVAASLERLRREYEQARLAALGQSLEQCEPPVPQE